MAQDNNREVIYGLYDDEEDLLRAVKLAKTDHLDIYDVFSPFPVHGLDPLLGLEESRLHQAGFIYGALGTMTAFLGMSWIFTKDWPNIFGGKPYWSVPAFIPITFELTVLFAAIGMTVTFYVINGLGPGVVNKHLDDRITDDKFCIAFDKSSVSSEKAQAFFKSTGASEVNSKTI
ncbi:MAG TPA: DUF3341 domain-containing protein [Saprospiraceae bacterium]|jgi:hypothetical protein|nr:DUF3341 domain-containing protein [Saprospiraceae bacterium]MBK8885474.1 DUF3341 domain-containing protein [Saprospiraceae bacterium]MBK9581049.1 DUF3341 domain-containing protein [Saprospiraceae bacterium]MBP6539395.1 DUF3341 domain-containing protein [Saprospiraceae bacterium]MBP9054891.1 DUF3341 domain-containing protein [Saprospiraceae bacterium]